MNVGPRAGQRFGAYRLDAVIGRGGMGVVFRGEHEHLGRTVAIKLLTPELASAPGFRERFLRESRLAAALEHPSVVTVFDAGEVDGSLYIAMRFVDGTDLAGLLAAEGPLQPERALAFVGQVAAALDAAHALRLVHRDVKPANVLIDGERAYLTDFGLTKPTADDAGLTAAGQFLGTLAYVAPEQIEGRALDGRADVYALGCVLYECLTGAKPYPLNQDAAVIYAHLREPPPRPSDARPGLPAALDGVIAKAMAKAPEQRYATCGALVAAARSGLDQRPPVVTEAHPLPEPTGPATARLETGEGTREAPARQAPVELPSLITAPLPEAIASAPAPARAEPRRRRRGGLLAALGVLTVAAAVGAAVLLSGGGDRSGSGSDSNSRDGTAFAVGDAPVDVTLAGGSVWVANSGDGTVTRIAPDGGGRKDVRVGDTPWGVSSDARFVWVANSGDATLDRIDIDSGEVAGEPFETEASPYYVVADPTRTFVTNGGAGTVSEWYAPSGKPRRAPFESGPKPRGIVTSDDAAWVANSGDGTVSRIEHGIVVDRFDVGQRPFGIAAGAGAIWVANSGDGTVSRIAIAEPDAAPQTFEVGDRPEAIAVGAGYVWVANRGDDTVMRLDPDDGTVVGEPFEVPGGPAGLAVGERSVWVSAYDRDELVRLEP
jgi:serine/threonine-protein kinase